ncbi:MAG: FecR domain-containing protein, partial [Herminiimonas sp.]|nr:FecR domain-containing protein [Herminiimonas sp.]
MRNRMTSLALALALTCGFSVAQQAVPLPTGVVAAPGSFVVAPASITYFAKGGDTLIAIAVQFTGKADHWVQIGKNNRIDRDSNIPIGTPIFIPAELLSDDPVEATVVALSGSITARKADGIVIALAIGAKVSEGTQIDTANNGFVTFALADSSRVSLPSNSRVKIGKLRMARYTKSPRTEIMLLRGRVESRVSPLEARKGLFEIRTPQSVAGVRGTHFRVGILANGVANEVLSGKVAVAKPAEGASLTLATAKGAIVDSRTVGPMVDLLPAPRLVARAGADYATAQFAIVPVAGASAYRVQLSTDSDAIDIIAENNAATPQVRLDGIPDGAYFVRISAIDRAGLEGLTRIEPVRISARADLAQRAAAGAPNVDHSNQREIGLKWQPLGGRSFVLQVARDADFSWLVHTVRTAVPQASVPR